MRKASARVSSIFISLRSIDAAAREELVRALEVVLGEVRVAVQDWRTCARALTRSSPN